MAFMFFKAKHSSLLPTERTVYQEPPIKVHSIYLGILPSARKAFSTEDNKLKSLMKNVFWREA
jgi:hypothetical protein